jgi:hypothetical protein
MTADVETHPEGDCKRSPITVLVTINVLFWTLAGISVESVSLAFLVRWWYAVAMSNP